MKCVIRQSCFETNSSSMHAIAVTDDDVHITHDELVDWKKCHDSGNLLWIDSNGELNISDVDEGFGRSPFNILISFKDKLKYAICEYIGQYHGDEPELQQEYQRILGIVQEVVPEIKDFTFSIKGLEIYYDKHGNILQHSKLRYKSYDAENNVCIYTYIDEDGQEIEAVHNRDYFLDAFDIGNIDHQSAGLLKRVLKEKNIDLLEFLTNKKYIIIIDSDEVHKFDALCKSGIINMDFIKRIYYTNYN